MKPLITTLLVLTLLTACAKHKSITINGRVIDIANWEYNQSIIGVKDITVCLVNYKSEKYVIKPYPVVYAKQKTCVITDNEGMFKLNMEVDRKDARKGFYYTKVEARTFVDTNYLYNDSRNTEDLTKKLGMITLGVSKIYPVIFTINNINFLNERDSLLIEDNQYYNRLLFMGNYSNKRYLIDHWINKSKTNPNLLNGQKYECRIYRNGAIINKFSLNDKIILQGDTGYFTINY